MTVATYTVTSMAAGEEDRIVERIYNISSDTSSEYDTDHCFTDTDHCFIISLFDNSFIYIASEHNVGHNEVKRA